MLFPPTVVPGVRGSLLKSGLGNFAAAFGPSAIAEFINCRPRSNPLATEVFSRRFLGKTPFQN